MKFREPIAGVLLLIVLCSFSSQMTAFARKPKPSQKFRPPISFDRYHTYDEMVDMLKVMARKHRRLMSLYSVGESFLGKKIWAAEIGNKLSGDLSSRPGFLVAGEHHGDEVIAKEVVLYFMWHLLTNYGRDPKVTRILDTRAIYVIPLVNPDGNDLTLLEGQIQRQNARPVDEDGDGLLDEDPPEDIDGDGKITDMRRWNETSGDYDYFMGEGIDNDGDDVVNEDFIGGVDLNRNYGYMWESPPWLPWPAFGEYPFSEPETQAVKDFVQAHPNIAVGFDTHSGAQCILYPWSHTFDPPPDADVYEGLGEKYSALTDYVYGHTPNILYPCTGTTMDWAYGDQGIIHFTNEVFGPIYFDPEEPFGEKFSETYPDVEVPWQTFEHPQLGTVEIGGYYYFRFYNPPEDEIETVCLRNLPMLLDLSETTPNLEITDVELGATRSREHRDLNLTIDLTNIGSLDTATQHAIQTGGAQPVTVEFQLLGTAELTAGDPSASIILLEAGQTVGISWRIRVEVPSINRAVIAACTSKGGVKRLLVTMIALPHKTLMFTKQLKPNSQCHT